MLIKRTNRVANGTRLSKALANLTGGALDRRTFLKRSGLTIGGLAAASALSLGRVEEAKAQGAASSGIKKIKTVCNHCAVGCTIIAEVDKGVWGMPWLSEAKKDVISCDKLRGLANTV